MADIHKFDSAHPLGAGIGRLGREELVALALALCAAAQDSEGGAHGCIHPMNVSLTDGPALGPKASHAPGDYSTDELEYMAPELFWDRKLTSAADVYSIGLMLYAGVTGGRLPFFPCGPESVTNEQRAAALRRRLNGEAIAIPPVAGEKLGEVLKKALAFDRAGRYENTAELAEDLRGCVGEGDAAAMAAFGKSERELSEVERTMAGIIASFDGDAAPAAPAETPAAAPAPSPAPEKPPEVEYRVDKGFEQRPQKKAAPEKPPKRQPPRKRGALYAVLAICVVVVAAALVVNAVWGLPGSGDDGIASPSPAPASAAPTPSAEPTPSPTPSPAPTPTPQPESTYQLFIEDVTWEEARDLCEEKGGHLVTISDAEELEKVTGLAETYGVSLVWIGFYRGQDGEIHWLNGEDIDYYIWGDGEPSGHDTDGAAEDYGLLWHTDGGWIYNDSRNDPVSAYPGIYSGNIAYICEYGG